MLESTRVEWDTLDVRRNVLVEASDSRVEFRLRDYIPDLPEELVVSLTPDAADYIADKLASRSLVVRGFDIDDDPVSDLGD